MAAINTKQSPNPFPKIDSVPNLRLLCKRAPNAPSSLHRSAAIYRSSKPDRLTASDLEEFNKLGIRCIVDFRSEDEFKSTYNGRQLLDEYHLFKVTVPKLNYIKGQSVQYKFVPPTNNSSPASSEQTPCEDNFDKNDSEELLPQTCRKTSSPPTKRHYLINFFSFNYLKAVFSRLPWHLWCLGFLHFVWDIITWNKMRTLKKFVASKAISTWGMFGQYIDIIEVSQPAICSALKLISDPENSPTLINCAFGKDRTGIVSALILSCLGKSKDYIAEEYALSTKGLDPVRPQVYREIVEKHCLGAEFCTSEAKTMRDLLVYIEDRYQSVEQYLMFIGFTEEDQEQLRNNFEAFPQVPSPN